MKYHKESEFGRKVKQWMDKGYAKPHAEVKAQMWLDKKVSHEINEENRMNEGLPRKRKLKSSIRGMSGMPNLNQLLRM